MTDSFPRRDLLRFGALACAAAGIAKAKADVPAPLPSEYSGLDKLANFVMNASTVPGLSLAVIHDGRVSYAQGYGLANVARNTAMTPQTVFQAASLTKPLFAYLVMKMIEQGALALDTPLTPIGSVSPISLDPRAATITARTVLTHTSGLPNWENNRWPMALKSGPGERFGYSSEAYIYLQKLVEGMKSLSLDQLMHEVVLVPIGLKASSMLWRNEFESSAALAYEWDGSPVRAVSHPTEASAASSLHTTPSDYAKFMISLMPGMTQDSDAAAYSFRRMMLSPQVALIPNLAWGLGWAVHLLDDGDRFWHFGDSRGFMCYAVGSRVQRSGIVIFANGRHGLRATQPLAELVMGNQEPIFRWIFDVFYEGKLQPWPSPHQQSPPPVKLRPKPKAKLKLQRRR